MWKVLSQVLPPVPLYYLHSLVIEEVPPCYVETYSWLETRPALFALGKMVVRWVKLLDSFHAQTTEVS